MSCTQEAQSEYVQHRTGGFDSEKKGVEGAWRHARKNIPVMSHQCNVTHAAGGKHTFLDDFQAV